MRLETALLGFVIFIGKTKPTLMKVVAIQMNLYFSIRFMEFLNRHHLQRHRHRRRHRISACTMTTNWKCSKIYWQKWQQTRLELRCRWNLSVWIASTLLTVQWTLQSCFSTPGMVSFPCWYQKYFLDPRLSWNRTEYGNTQRIIVDPDLIWTPPVEIVNLDHYGNSGIVNASL